MKDEIEKISQEDVYILVTGLILVYIFIWIMLGKCNTVEHRTWLSFFGISSVGLGMITSYGICQFMELYYTSMHKILPALLFGIGIDDMFVIVQAFDALNYNKNKA